MKHTPFKNPVLYNFLTSRLSIHSVVANKQHQRTQGIMTIVEKNLKLTLWILLLVPWSKLPSSSTGGLQTTSRMVSLNGLSANSPHLLVAFRRKSKSFISACRLHLLALNWPCPLCLSSAPPRRLLPVYCFHKGSSLTCNSSLLPVLLTYCFLPFSSKVTVSERSSLSSQCIALVLIILFYLFL